jgi:hypothetical protein
MWVDPKDDPRETDDQPVDERGILLDHLRAYRLTLEMKCAGLDAEQMARRSTPPSSVRCRTEEDRDGDFNGAVADPAVVDEARLNRAVAVGEADGPRAGLAALAALDDSLPRHTAVAAYLHERDGAPETAARLYTEAARKASNLAERVYLTRQAARLNADRRR